MKRTFTFTKGRLIGFLCWSLLPTLAIIFGIMILTYGVRLNYGASLAFIVLSLLAIGLLALLMFSNCKNVWKAILSVVFLYCFATSFFFLTFITSLKQVKHYEAEELSQHYETVCAEMPHMPQLSQIGQPVDVDSYYALRSMGIFSTETDYLICRYTPEEYKLQKAALEEKYVFQEENLVGYQGNENEPSVQVGDYRFRMLSVEEYSLDYPKSFVLIGYSDDACEIVYMTPYSFDQDDISSLENYITFDCVWEYVLKESSED